MPDYRRWFVKGGTYFFTVLTHLRRNLFNDALPRRILRDAIQTVRSTHPFDIVAVVLLPDHLHTVWTLPPLDSHFPMRWRRIKEAFTRTYMSSGGVELRISSSRSHKQERGIWQRRYWEHTVRDEADLKRCVDYIHWNPKKHGYVQRVRDWPYSSFHRFVEKGEYDIHWGRSNPTPGYEDPEWGE